MRTSLVIGMGTGAVATYALMSKNMDFEKTMKKQSKKVMKKLQDFFN